MEELRTHKKTKPSKIAIIVISIAIIVLTAFYLTTDMRTYAQAIKLEEESSFVEAIAIYEKIPDYKDSTVRIHECNYQIALNLNKEGQYREAQIAFEALGDYSDSSEHVKKAKYEQALILETEGNYTEAQTAFEALGDYSDSSDHVKWAKYKQALTLETEGKYTESQAAFEALGDYSDSFDHVKKAKYEQALTLETEGKYTESQAAFEALGDYSDSPDHVIEAKYQQAIAIQRTGNIQEALDIFIALTSYKDSAENAASIQNSLDKYSTEERRIKAEENALDDTIAISQAMLAEGKTPLDLSKITDLQNLVKETISIRKSLPERPPVLSDIITAEEQLKAISYTAIIDNLAIAQNNLADSIVQYTFVDAPEEAFIIDRLSRLHDIAFITAVTEDTDPNNLIGKQGSYISKLFFSSPLVDPEYLNMPHMDLVEEGMDCGGTIEVFNTVEDAKKRYDYIDSISGSVPFTSAGSSRKVIGTILIRTSNRLKASQQKKLETSIIDVLTSLDPGPVIERNSSRKEETVSSKSEEIKIPLTYTASAKGFAGPVTILLTLKDDGTITSLQIGDEKFNETENYGAKVKESSFTKQFVGKTLPLTIEDIDAISGATITTKAVVEALNKAIEDKVVVAPAAPEGTRYTASEKGFAGPVAVFVTVKDDGTVTALEVGDDQFNETQNYGAAAKESSFTKQFVGKTLPAAIENIDAISGATITTKAVIAAMNRAYEEKLVDASALQAAQSAEAAQATEAVEAPAIPEGARTETSFSKGYGGPVAVTIWLNDNDTIAAMTIGDADFAETQGFGSRTQDPEFINTFIGKKVPLADGDVDVLAGATVTSQAVIKAVNKAAEKLGIAAEAATPEASAEPVQESAAPSDGKTATSSSKGYAGPVAVTITLNDDNTIAALSVGDADFAETDGLGSRTKDAEFTDRFIGKKVPLADGDVDVLAGATVTSEAVIKAVNKAAEKLGVSTSNNVFQKNNPITGLEKDPTSETNSNGYKVTHEYEWKTSLSHNIGIVVKNISGINSNLDMQVIFYDASDRIIGISNLDATCEDGYEVLMVTSNDTVFDHVAYTITTSEASWYYDVHSIVNVTASKSGNKAIISATNHGTIAARFVQYHCLFLDPSGKVVDYAWGYITDRDTELKPGKMELREARTYKDFSTVVVYFEGGMYKL